MEAEGRVGDEGERGVYACVFCVCVCVEKRERERRGRGKCEGSMH